MRKSIIYLSLLLTMHLQAAPIDQVSLDAIKAQSRDARYQRINEDLRLTEDEKSKFWPVYEAYRKEQNEVNSELIGLQVELAENFQDIADKRAQEINSRIIDLVAKRNNIHDDYTGRFQKIMAPRKAALFFILDSSVDNKLSNDLSELLIKTLDDSSPQTPAPMTN